MSVGTEQPEVPSVCKKLRTDRNTKDKDDWRLRSQFTWKMAVKMVSVCII